MDGPQHLCNLFAIARGLDPIGYAGSYDAFVAFELPLPWPRGLFDSRSKLLPEVREAVARYRLEAPYRLSMLAMAPDEEYSAPGWPRVLWCSRPDGAFADYQRAEYLVPEPRVGELVTALITARGAAPEFEPLLVHAAARELMVCTHGSEDAACGLYGVPLYHGLRASAAAGARVWRVSHFGGHVFAPTLLELPSGRFWAHLDDYDAAGLLDHRRPSAELRERYRGWAALDGPFLQALERELLVREGWHWLELPKRGAVLDRDDADEPRWQRVRIDAQLAHAAVSYEALVELNHWVDIRPRSDSPEERLYAQYRVTRLSTSNVALPAAVMP